MTRLRLHVRMPWLDAQPDPEDPDQDPDPAESVYDGEIVVGDVSTDTSAGPDVVETGDVMIRIVSAELATATSLLELRPERLRAAVVNTSSDSVVLHGTVERVGVKCDEPAEGDDLRLWDVLVRETAREDIEAALPGVACRGLVATLTAAGDVEQVPVRIHDADANLHSETWGWTDLRALVEEAFREAGAAAVDVPVPQLGIYYTGAGGDVAVARVPVRLAVATARGNCPPWTGEDVWGVWRGLMGARLYASYAAYPSALINVATRDGRWSEPDAPPPTYPPVDGYELSAEPADAPGFRLALGRALYNVLEGYAPPAAAYEAGGSGDPEEVPVRIPRILADSAVAFSQGSYSEIQSVGYPIIDRVAEKVEDSDTGDDLVYLVALVDTPAGPRALVYRTPDDPPPVNAGPARVNESWAAALFSNHQMRAWETFSARLEIDIVAADAAGLAIPDVGEVEQGFTLEDRAWAVTEMGVDVHTGIAALTGVRPSRPLSDPYATSGVATPGEFMLPLLAALIREEQAEGQAGPEGPPSYFAMAFADGRGADRVDVQYLATPAGLPSTWQPYTERLVVASASDHRYFRARGHFDVYGVATAWVNAGTDGSTSPPVGAPA